MGELTDPNAECRAKVGMLVLRDCRERARAVCDLCGRPVCNAHQSPCQQGIACPECAAEATTTEQQKAAAAPEVKKARRRRRWYRQRHYRPYYFGHRHGYYDHYYSDQDYRTFDDAERRTVGTGTAEATDEAAEADSDDFGPSDFDVS